MSVDENNCIKEDERSFLFRFDSLVWSFIFLELFLFPIFFSKDTCDFVFLYISFVLVFVPIIVSNNQSLLGKSVNYNVKFSIKCIYALRSRYAYFIFFYAFFITFRTFAVQGYSYLAFQEHFLLQLLPLFLYIITINRLSLDYYNFYRVFFFILAFFATLNAIFNLLYYFSQISTIEQIIGSRLGSESVGVATGKAATTFAFAYSIYCITSFIIFLESNNKIIKFSAVYFFIILLSALLLTNSRSSILSLTATITGYVFFEKEKVPIKVKVFLFFGFLTFSLFFLTTTALSNRLLTDGGRMDVWRQALSFVVKKPIFGYGEDDFYVHMLFSSTEYLYHGHNIFINALLRGGIIGLVSLSVFLTGALVGNFKLKKITNDTIPFYLMFFLTLAGLFDFDIVVRGKGFEWITFWTVIAVSVGGLNKLKSNTS